MNEENFMPDRLTRELVKMVGFRNIIANDYEEKDYTIVYDVLQNKLKHIEAFLKKIF